MTGSKHNQRLLTLWNLGYRPTKRGTIKSPHGAELVGSLHNGYLKIVTPRPKPRYKVSVHKLVAYSKYGDAIFDDGVVIRHLDGNPLNNSFENISVGSHSDNMMDVPKVIRVHKAARAARKWTKQIPWIWALLKSGLKQADIVRAVGIPKSTLSYIVNKKTYNVCGLDFDLV